MTTGNFESFVTRRSLPCVLQGASGSPGSVSRAPGIVFMDHFDLYVEIFAGQHDIFAIDLEKRNRDHQCAGKIEGVVLCEGKIMRHLRAPSMGGADPRSMAPVVSGAAAITAQAKPSGGMLA